MIANRGRDAPVLGSFEAVIKADVTQKTSSSANAERPRELGDFKKTRVNGGTDNDSIKGFSQVSPLPLTDPHHMVIKLFLLLGLAAEYRSRRWM